MNMKKITFLSTLLLTLVSVSNAQVESGLSGSATYGFESEFVFRGFNIAGDTFTPSAEGRVNSEMGTYYAGVRTALPTQKDDNRRKMHEYYLGGEVGLGSDFVLDLGISHYEFLPFTDESATEGVLGLTWDTVLSPAFYIYSDSDGEMTTYELSLGYALALDKQSAIMFTGYAGQSEFMLAAPTWASWWITPTVSLAMPV